MAKYPQICPVENFSQFPQFFYLFPKSGLGMDGSLAGLRYIAPFGANNCKDDNDDGLIVEILFIIWL